MLPPITKPPIFESRQQLLNFFSQDTIAPLRPLGAIVGIELQPIKEKPKPVVEELKPEESKPEENSFWAKVGYKPEFKAEEESS